MGCTEHCGMARRELWEGSKELWDGKKGIVGRYNQAHLPMPVPKHQRYAWSFCDSNANDKSSHAHFDVRVVDFRVRGGSHDLKTYRDWLYLSADS